jgi:hypothetical protein
MTMYKLWYYSYSIISNVIDEILYLIVHWIVYTTQGVTLRNFSDHTIDQETVFLLLFVLIERL